MKENRLIMDGYEIYTPYTPTILRNLAEICETFGVSEEKVKAWVKAGAPIVVDGEGRGARYSAELMQLHLWRRQNCAQAEAAELVNPQNDPRLMGD